MKNIRLALVLFFSVQAYAQQLDSKNNNTPIPLLLSEYPNITAKFVFSDKVQFDADTAIPINLMLDPKAIRKSFSFSQTEGEQLTRSLREVMHRFPGDGSDYFICARGFDH